MRALLHETTTGEMVTELDFSAITWSTGVCRADEAAVTIPGYTGRSWWQFMVPRKYAVSVSEDDGRVRAAGILSIPEGDTDRDGTHHVVFPFRGPESIFDRRYVLPYPYWPLVDADGLPIASRDTRVSGVEYGTMMKRLIQQALSHPGGQLPVSFEADRSGTREKSWTAVSGKPVQDAIEDISELEGGVEWDWVPSVDENDRLRWTFVTATDTARELVSAFWHTWQSGGAEPDIKDLNAKISPEFLTQTAIFTGGKDDDRVLVGRATGTSLIEAGVPLSEVWDSSHSSVSEQATLDAWARRRLEDGASPIQYWSFAVRAERADGLRHGDWCTIEVTDHWLIPDGSYPRRILEVSGSHDNDWYGVVVAGMTSW
ncbi:hypothetical protein [Leucobacter massiliensis]|uniref:Uncharacterized protein n=1 Tax=Leucobacter massiliensis TaxID=1686285 RepID=A0A2S9QMU3_9MICO|nr:hypothetical protein [Leucobacter massiliensis]PRI10913.1 hypothetical protein B4915_08490 [Leucobacter massiliensis]